MSAAAAYEILHVRSKQADEYVTEQLRGALIRVDKLEYALKLAEAKLAEIGAVLEWEEQP